MNSMMQKRWYSRSEWVYIGLACLAALLIFPMLTTSRAAWGAWWILLFALAYMVCPLFYSGRALRVSENKKKISRGEALGQHRRAVAILTGLTLVGFIGVETSIRKVGGLWGDPLQLTIHLILAGGTAIAYVTVRFFYTGTRAPHYHQWFVYVFMMLYVSVFVTGTILIAEKFSI